MQSVWMFLQASHLHVLPLVGLQLVWRGMEYAIRADNWVSIKLLCLTCAITSLCCAVALLLLANEAPAVTV
jgi:hypothetical protein